MKAFLATACAAVAITIAMAWPVVEHPREQIYGEELSGRHHDPFTVMWQFEHARPAFPYRQPLVDDVGAAVSRAAGPVAAYNLIVLASFPFAAVAAFLLARWLGISNGAASIGALAYAFAPPHLAHAAYHPHTAQTQWIPLYFLSLWWTIERPSAARLAAVTAAGAATAAASLYAGLAIAVTTPVAAGAWISSRRSPQRRWLAPIITVAGLAATWIVLRAVSTFVPDAYAVSHDDLLRYGAHWVSYFRPPSDPEMPGIVEQQMNVSWALLLLAAIALWRPREFKAGPVLAALGAWAAFCSLAPTFPLAPASLINDAAPMFRALARIGLITHLCVALLAAAGLMRLWRHSRALAAMLVAVAAVEYSPLPPRARDVLPTSAHRWLARQPVKGRVLDCVNAAPSEAHVPWLMRRDVATLGGALPSCLEPNIAQQAAALGFSHLIIRESADAHPLGARARDGYTPVRTAPDAAVYEFVDARPRPIVLAMAGFSPTEHDASQRWKWMGARGEWIVEHRGANVVDVQLELHLSSIDGVRRLALELDGRPLTTFATDRLPSTTVTPIFQLAPGVHRLTFVPLEPAARAPAGDGRILTIKLIDWRWR